MIKISDVIDNMAYDLDIPIFKGWEQLTDEQGNHTLRKGDREINISCTWPGLLYGIIIYYWEREKGKTYDRI